MSSLSACSGSAHCSKFLFGQGCFSQLQQLPTKQVYKTWARNRESKDTEKRGFAATRSPTEQPKENLSCYNISNSHVPFLYFFNTPGTFLAIQDERSPKDLLLWEGGKPNMKEMCVAVLSSGTNSSKSVFHGSQEPGVVLTCFCFG